MQESHNMGRVKTLDEISVLDVINVGGERNVHNVTLAVNQVASLALELQTQA